MWRIDAVPELPGGEITSADGTPPTTTEQVDSVTCQGCGAAFEVTSRRVGNRYYPTIPCLDCGGIIGIQYGDEPFETPWEILDLSGESPGECIVADGEKFGVFDERSSELTAIHRAGECLARATSMEFRGDGKYSVQAMNTLVVTEGSGIAVGYVTWNTFDSETSTYPALRQIYLLPAYRQRGLGSALVEYWVESVVDDFIVDTPGNVYCVEQPNDDMRALLRSLGHHSGNDDKPTASDYTPHQM